MGKYFTGNKNELKKFKGSDYYYLDGYNNLYFRSFNTGKFELMLDVDIDSFVILTNWYSNDKTAVYCESKRLKKNCHNFIDYRKYGYFNIDGELYWFGKKVKTRLEGEFENINEHFFTDGKNLFVNGQLYEFNFETFVVLNKFYAKDNTLVFCSERLIPSADANSFQVINEDTGYSETVLATFPFLKDEGYSTYDRDKNNVYFLGDRIFEGLIDPASTKVMKTFIVLDKKHVFYHDKLVEGANPASFEIIFNLKYPLRSDYPRLFTDFYRDDHHLFFLYQHGRSESKNNIKICTKSNLKHYRDQLQKVFDNQDSYTLHPEDVDRIRILLGI